ncbi:MAG: methyltransferase domain-containing protein [Thermodesulfobacteriota bacterium]
MITCSEFYSSIHDLLCGAHPNVYPWHFQWLAIKHLNRDLRRLLPELSGRVLDVGCGLKPYENLLTGALEYRGLDVKPGPQVDLVISPRTAWPVPEASFDAVLSTQVLEHVSDLQFTLSEIHRVLSPGGVLILSAPFIYNQHGAPDDFFRWSKYGLKVLLGGEFEITNIKTQGRVGSTLGSLFLNWLDMSFNLTKGTRFLKGFLLPLWMIFSLLTNLFCTLIDCLDRTDSFYANVLVTARKKTPAAGDRLSARAGPSNP